MDLTGTLQSRSMFPVPSVPGRANALRSVLEAASPSDARTRAQPAMEAPLADASNPLIRSPQDVYSHDSALHASRVMKAPVASLPPLHETEG